MSNPNPARGGILCPVDLGEQSVPVVRLAASMARACATSLVVLHASDADVPPYFTPRGANALESELSEARAAARLRLAALIEGLPDAHLRVEDGDPAAIVDRVSSELQSSMIVMGTHGRTGLARLIEGSIAETVLHQSRIPVLTVGSKDDLATTESILCPVAGNELSQTALTWAIRLSNCLHRKLTILHVTEPGVAPLPDPGLPGVEHVIRDGNPADEILKFAAETHTGLLVIAAVHKVLRDRTAFGATAEKLIRHSPCPVLTVFPTA
jgi:nucleotide-binding universal stress UspA family protein